MILGKMVSFQCLVAFQKMLQKYFGHFGVLKYFGHIIGFRVILVSLEVSMGILIFWKFRRYFGHFRDILVILLVLGLF